MDIDEIRELKTHYETNLYGTVRKEQRTDETYINNTFPVPEIHEPHQIYRSPTPDRIVNAPAEHIITSNPQVFFHPRKDTKEANASALKLSRLINQSWLPILQKQNPNIFKEFIKDLLGRGEAFFKIIHDEKGILPVNISVPDAMVVYASPEESVEGVPDKVIVWYSLTQYQDLIPKYPQVKEVLESKKAKNEMVTWLEYYDSKQRYVEVAATALTKGGVQTNIYGFTPFVRKYSGFGRKSPDGDLASLIVSDIRRSRDLIREECATRSNIASSEYLFAHKAKTIIGEGLNVDELRSEIAFGAYDINYIPADPARVKIDELNIIPSPEMERHLIRITQELNQRHPFIMAGFPLGTSGRQQDLTELSAMRRYDSIVENCEHAFATIIGMALKLCLLPNLKPDGITEQDLRTKFDIEVKLKAKDPIEEDRKVTLGDRLWAGGRGSIDLETFHTEFQGKTIDESKRIKAKMLVDQLTLYNPDVASVLGMVFGEESGLADWLEKARARREQMEQQQGGGLRKELPPTSQERIKGEVQTPFGSEEAVGRGARQSPERFTRGGR